MKKFLKGLMLLTLCGMLILPSLGMAELTPPPGAVILPSIITTSGDLVILLQTALNWIFFALVFVAIVMILFVGFNFVTKGGKDKDGVKDEWGKLTNVLIGVAVALAAKGLVYLVCSMFVGGYCKFF